MCFGDAAGIAALIKYVGASSENIGVMKGSKLFRSYSSEDIKEEMLGVALDPGSGIVPSQLKRILMLFKVSLCTMVLWVGVIIMRFVGII